MRNFAILIKYLSNPYNTRSKKSTVKGNFFRQILQYIIGSVPLGLIVYFFTIDLFEKIYNVDPLVARYMYLMWSSMLSLFFVIGFIGLGMYSLSRNEEVELLLTMPISRTVISAYQIFSATISQIYTLSFFIFISLAYFVSTNQNVLLGILKIVLHIWFLISFSSVIAVLIGGRTSKSFTKRFYTIVLLLSVFFYFFIIAMTDVDVSEMENLVKMFIFSTKDYNFLAWSLISNKTLGYSLISSIFLSILFLVISKKVGFEPVQVKRKERYQIAGTGSILKALFKKDLKAAIRYEQFLYFILYPLGFGIFMMFINNQGVSPIFYTIPIFTFYVAFETGILTISEVSKIEVVSTYPITFKKLMMPKLLIPVGLNFLLLLLVFVISLFFNAVSIFLVLSMIFSLLLFLMSSVLGAYYAIKSPNVKSNNTNRVFSISATFIIEGITMGLAFGIIMPLSFIIERGNSPWWVYLIFVGSLVTSFLIFVMYFRKLVKIIYSKL
ncbi:hypothetical protein SU69_03795 [Thermosipho melanesiensis]|uniref:ABC-2 type transport system permease protein n=2 Tax=Thermosipho melanesiensis TaxID=46541 RepID=A6LL01_THEM4|nr:hypothetical protein [Thermosipho melanesiensis]ABR30602.1 hypothetical protein Tmel_0739 [Thermosipho melanesiensis BI429]APT73744.1 hypothetical protein BW47_03995 [Thermosipho melanesiensis]OOC35683.1 hypothetical protein SU68_03850 [Thermosipho melanesiensis]OOC38982.1 hypothetical protein SU69_03795 [Thermosipho melanesiensis]OOC39130.1 hypothetical protein SU70_03795 [Thermosipho melanesiensis]